MAHVKRGVTTKARRKKILEKAKGFRGRAKNCIRIARIKTDKAGQYAYRDRRAKKRTFRALWIMRINAGAREHGLTYSQLIRGLKLAGVTLDRKVLADIAARDAAGFKTLAEQAASALPKTQEKKAA